jgi:hypothetical protein
MLRVQAKSGHAIAIVHDLARKATLVSGITMPVSVQLDVGSCRRQLPYFIFVDQA